MTRDAAQPNWRFLRVERIVGHDYSAHASHLEDALDVRFDSLRSEEIPGGGERGMIGRQLESMQDRNHATRSFGNRSVIHKESTPNGVGFLARGEIHIEYADGCVVEHKAPQVVAIEPGHDGWVVGKEPCVVIDWQGFADYAKR